MRPVDRAGLVHREHTGAERLQYPGPAAGAGAEIETCFAGLRPDAEQRERLPQLQLGAAGWRRVVLDEMRFAVRGGAGAGGGSEQCVAIEQGPGTTRRLGGWRAERERSSRDVWQVCLDQGVAAMAGGGIECPVALHGTELSGCVADRRDGQAPGIAPDIGAPGDWLFGGVGEDQAAVGFADGIAKLGLEFGEESFVASKAATRCGRRNWKRL